MKKGGFILHSCTKLFQPYLRDLMLPSSLFTDKIFSPLPSKSNKSCSVNAVGIRFFQGFLLLEAVSTPLSVCKLELYKADLQKAELQSNTSTIDITRSRIHHLDIENRDGDTNSDCPYSGCRRHWQLQDTGPVESLIFPFHPVAKQHADWHNHFRTAALEETLKNHCFRVVTGLRFVIQ